MQTFIKLARTSAVYFTGAALTKIIGLLMLPVYTKYVAAEGFGYFDASLAYLAIMTALLFLEGGTVLLRFTAGSISREKREKVISGAFALFIFSCAAFSALYWVIYSFLKFNAGAEIFFCGLTGALYVLYGYIARSKGSDKLFALCGLFTAALQAALNLYFLAYLKTGFFALYWSSIIASAAGILVFEIFTRALTREFSPRKIDIKLIKEMLAFSLPLVMNVTVFWFFGAFNRVGIAAVLGDAANGIYAVAAKFSIIITVAGGCFALAWQEMSFHKAEDKAPAEFFSTTFAIYLKIILCLYILLVPAVNIIFPHFVAPAFHGASALIPLYMLWVMLDMITHFLGTIMAGKKNTREIFITTLCGAALNVALLALLLRGMGAQGSNIALCAGFALMWLLREVFLRRSIGFKMNYTALLPALLPALPFAAVAALYPLEGTYNYWFFAAGAVFTLLFLRREITAALRHFYQGNS